MSKIEIILTLIQPIITVWFVCSSISNWSCFILEDMNKTLCLSICNIIFKKYDLKFEFNTRISQSFSVVPWTLRYQYLPVHNIIAFYDKKAYQFYARMHIKDEEFPNISFVVPNKSDLDKCLQSLVHNDVFKFI